MKKKNLSLKKLMEGIDWDDTPKVNRFEVTEGVRSYQQIGSSVFGGTSILETAKQLSKIVEDAQSHVLSENDVESIYHYIVKTASVDRQIQLEQNN